MAGSAAEPGIAVVEWPAQPVAEQPLEVVERKGLGHPDTICDAVAEQVAQALVHAYRERAGTVLHFNVDKGLLVAGRVEQRLGGGRVLAPMRLVVGDRATDEVNGAPLPLAEIVIGAAHGWLATHLPHVDPARDVLFQVELQPSSPELAAIFRRRDGVLPANDTSTAVGYAPLTETERLVLEAEGYLNSSAFKAAFPDTGQDVKVTGVRRGGDLDLTVAMPLLDAYVTSEAGYFRRKEEILQALHAYLDATRHSLRLDVRLNTLDSPGLGLAGMYLSVLGTSAESGDSGEVGRGNHANGLIPLNRPASAEAAAGKNPLSHPGKIYNVLSHVLAQHIYEQVGGLREVYVWLGARIGSPLDRPALAAAQLSLAPGTHLADVAGPAQGIVAEALAEMPTFTERLSQGLWQAY